MASSDDSNSEINNFELEEREEWKKDESRLKYLYPSLNDPFFNKKIAEKREFNDTRYSGEILDIAKEAERLCNSEFELSPHQQFVKNFLSLYTPYNSLLLFHGLGSGKTCSAIGVAEEMRDYTKQMGISQRIIVVASPNVQDNFKLQLFDESRLELVDGLWNINSCVGNKLLREINPLNMRGMPRARVISLIKNLINSSYLFIGYTGFANFIEKQSFVPGDLTIDRKKIIKQKLKQVFNNRLIIIDEVHNIRFTDDNKRKRIASELKKLVTNVDNLRLLFLSATPLYNTYKEIIWLINIMNLNDKRSTIELKDVFDQDGNFLPNSEGEDKGQALLERKATGYVSFVRGDNPYTFPYKIWPEQFAPEKSIKSIVYPRVQINSKDVSEPIQFLSLYMVSTGGYQTSAYNYIVSKLSSTEDFNIEKMEQLGYIQLTKPLEALNIIYPNEDVFENDIEATVNIKNLVGKEGLNSVMTYKKTVSPPSITNFKYREEILDQYGRIFARDNIETYSAKIKAITDNILNSTGIVLIYSQYLDGGVVPIALALEEMGITRYGSTPSLFEKRPVENLDLKTYTNTNSKDSIPAKYIMITGDNKLSPDNISEVKAARQKNNLNGEKIKVILISQAGSEGLDFKFLRQVHILEPWYNLSRIDQIIGRAVRNCSHKDLPLEERNVQVYLYGSELIDNSSEAADLYVYRLAEQKAIKIGKVTRVLKEISVDCLLNSEQTNFSAENMKITLKQKISDGKTIDYQVGDKPFTQQCDFQDTCMYKCKPENLIGEVNTLSYTKNFIEMNIDKITLRIKQLMKEKYFYEKNNLIREINLVRQYPTVQIYAALTELIDNNELISDKYGRYGKLINIDNYYFFQPIELNSDNISIYERSAPIPYKHQEIKVNISDVASISKSKTLKIVPKILSVLSEADDEIDEEVDNTVEKAIKSAETIEEPTIIPIESEPKILPGKKLLDKMLEDYNSAMTKQIIIRGDKDVWYKHCYYVFKELEEMGVSKEILDDLLISHLVEMNLYDDLINILNYIYFNDSLTSFENKILNYFDNYVIKHKDITGILLPGWDPKAKKSMFKLLIKNDKERKWKLGESEDYNDFWPKIKQDIIPKSEINNTFGFITNFKNTLMVFKVKDGSAGNTGARCDQGAKLTAVKLNILLDKKYHYTDSTIKKRSAAYLCVLQEFLLRINNYNKTNGKKWFLTPIEFIFYSSS
jgi:superfamily II DNA or RNA helicase